MVLSIGRHDDVSQGRPDSLDSGLWDRDRGKQGSKMIDAVRLFIYAAAADTTHSVDPMSYSATELDLTT